MKSQRDVLGTHQWAAAEGEEPLAQGSVPSTPVQSSAAGRGIASHGFTRTHVGKWKC